MKIYIALLLSCASLMGADLSIHVASTTNYVGPGKSVSYKMDVFIRGGQTNLVCDTRTKDGALVVRLQTFYHHGFKVAMFVENPSIQEFEVEPGSPYSVRFRLHSPRKSDSGEITISAKDGGIVDMFTCTNGVYYPVQSYEILDE
jgi:hypothetical protein